MSVNFYTFQLATVLIEAVEDEGQKKEAVIQRVKNMLSLMRLNGSRRS